MKKEKERGLDIRTMKKSGWWNIILVLTSMSFVLAACGEQASGASTDDSGFDSSDQGTDSAETSDTESDEHTETSPPDDTWKFAVMGDSRSDTWGTNTAVLNKLVTAVINQNVEVVVFTGDSVMGAFLLGVQMPPWLETMQPLWDAGIAVYPTRGNHEAMGINLGEFQTWQNAFVGQRALPQNGPQGQIKATYSAVHKNALFVSLDNYIAKGKVPQDWLDVQIAQMEVPHLFVFGHEPAFMVEHSDCLDDFPNVRDEFWQSLQSAGARTYFCGHDHFYDHARVSDGDGDPDNDLHQYIVGTGGVTPRKWSPTYNGDNSGMTIEQISHVEDFGYVLGEVTGLDVRLTWIGIDGDQGDSWSYTVE